MNTKIFHLFTLIFATMMSLAVERLNGQDQTRPIQPTDPIPEAVFKELTRGKPPLGNISDELLDTLRTGGAIYLLEDTVLEFHWRIQGDRGSYANYRARSDGLYLHIAPHSSFTKRFSPNSKINPGAPDKYVYWPKHLRISARGNVQRNYLYPTGFMYENKTWYRNATVTPPAPPEKAIQNHRFNSIQEAQKWISECSEWSRQNPSLSLRLEDRRLAGQKINVILESEMKVEETTQVIFPKNASTRSRQVSLHFENKYPLLADSIPPVHWERYLNQELHLLDEVTINDIGIRKSGSSDRLRVLPTPNPMARFRPQVLSDHHATERYYYSLGQKTKVDATLEPTATDEAQWMPNPREERTYRLTIQNPLPKEVEKVRFLLEGTTAYSGICTNAGNHNFPEERSCPDCSKKIQGVLIRSVAVDPGQESSVTISRVYDAPNECVLDELYDIFFRDDRNPDYELENDIAPEGLQYKISQELSRDAGGAATHDVVVTIRDGAASSRLSAEILVNGYWHAVKAIGPTASEDGEQLFLPNDQNRDKVADVWNDLYGNELSADTETSHNDKYPGDGLTAFEEYRSLMLAKSDPGSNELVRLNPEQLDVFIHDYENKFSGPLDTVKEMYRAAGVGLHMIHDWEFYDDIINPRETEYKLSNQFIIVVMPNPVRPIDVGITSYSQHWSLWAGRVSAIGPPKRDNNTIFMQVNRYAPCGDDVWMTLGHEIGHMLGVRHHGETDRWIEVNEEQAELLSLSDRLDFSMSNSYKFFCATPGGQHSGDRRCWMGYRAAELFCERGGLSLSKKTAELFGIWPESSLSTTPAAPLLPRSHFCDRPDGTGVNVNQKWAKNSGKGCGCQEQLRVRSY